MTQADTTQLTVIQALPALVSGGVEQGTLEIAEALVQRGHRSIVISSGGPLAEDLIRDGSEHVKLGIGKKSPFSLRLIPRLRRLFLDTGADILHVRSRMPAWLCYLAWRGMTDNRRPHFITSVHGCYSVNRYSRIMLAGERVIAISRFIHDYIIENYPGIDANNIVTIPRGVSNSRFPRGLVPDDDWKRRWYEEFPLTRDKQLVTLPGRITRLKGHEDFLKLMHMLETDRDIHGLIVGGADGKKRGYLDELKANCAASGLKDRISFTGYRKDVREIMGLSSVVLSLSNKPEAFGRTVLEALSLGVPVIAYNHGGVTEIMQNIFPDGLVATGDLVNTASLIRDIIHNGRKVDRINPYTLDRMQQKTIELYEALATQCAKP
jgi:glycosyltransferase involved in cell wall biosynthesis